MDTYTKDAWTDIQPNDAARCYEAWRVDQATGLRRLLSTCSMCVPEEQYVAWTQQLGQQQPLAGLARAA